MKNCICCLFFLSFYPAVSFADCDDLNGVRSCISKEKGEKYIVVKNSNDYEVEVNIRNISEWVPFYSSKYYCKIEKEYAFVVVANGEIRSPLKEGKDYCPHRGSAGKFLDVTAVVLATEKVSTIEKQKENIISDEIMKAVQEKIYNESGYKFDLRAAAAEYKKYFDPNRKMNSFEVKGGPVQIGGGCIDKTFGECLETAAKRLITASCDTSKYSNDQCYLGAKNMIVMIFTMNRLISARSLPKNQRDKEINLGLFVTTLRKYDQKAKESYGAIYDRLLETVEASINSLSSTDTNLLDPTAEYVLSLSESEKAAYFFSAVALGAAVLVEYTKYVCSDGGCSNINVEKKQYDSNTNYAYEDKIATTPSSVDYRVNSKSKVVLNIKKSSFRKAGAYSWQLYNIACQNGHSGNIFYNTQNRCWMKESSFSCDYSSDPNALSSSAKTFCENN